MLALIVLLVMLVGSIPLAAFAEGNTASAGAKSASGMTVSVGRSEITIQVNGIGTSGTAKVYRYGAEEYHTKDPLHGQSQRLSGQGELVGDYTCGTSKTITINRYNKDGSDNLYEKYYVIQNGNILAGPVYASEIYSVRSVDKFDVHTKKGLITEDYTTIDMAKEMGVGSTVINHNLTEMIYANEDADGKPIDNSKRGNVIKYESNGETFYFNANYIRSQDGAIAAYSRAGINVTMVVIAWEKMLSSSYPESLIYVRGNRQTMAFNTSNARGAKYWVAAMEFLADRYSQSENLGLVNKFVIGNEIDYTYDWYLIQDHYAADGKTVQRADFDVFMEEYMRTVRLANNAVKKYNSKAQVALSFTHNWAESCYDSYRVSDNGHIRYNSYAPKDMLDWVFKNDKARGDYDWGITAHPYPIGTTSDNPIKSDPTWSYYYKPITGDWKTSPWITAANLELYDIYFGQEEHLYNGKMRFVSLTETSICNENQKKVTAENYRLSTYRQAASIAQYYYRAACVECIDEIDYFQPHDQSTNKLGLMTEDGVKKPSYNVWKYVDTDKSFAYAGRYLKYIDENAKSFKDIMAAVEVPEFDWNTKWDESKIIRRTVSLGNVERTIKTDKDTYNADDSILVTATGDVGDTVGLYLASDNVATADPLYSYPVHDPDGTVKFKNGKTYDIVAYGEASALRATEAYLKAGKYKVVLTRGDTGATISKTITIAQDYSMGSTSNILKTNKDEYVAGEDIIVTASGANSSDWVGLYKVGDNYGTGVGTVTSIYWYYVNNPGSGQIPGKPTILQSTIHGTGSSNPGNRISSGEYILYLFAKDGYSILKSKKISIVPGHVDPLKSITYKMEDATDGYANGVVTITKDPANEAATDCLMYWADANGKPLEGYTALAKFKLEEEVTKFEMYHHTIIPEGAKKLIAYGTDGDALSDTAVSVDLPENSSYKLGNDYDAEFQVVSDIHITTDADANNEVKYSNTHMKMLLEDVQENSPNSLGIFVNGDISNTGKKSEYEKLYNIYQEAKFNGKGRLPELHLSIGNHDWYGGNPSNLFEQYVGIFNPSVGQPEKVYYTEEVGGYNFIYLGSEKKCYLGVIAEMSQEQLDWLDQKLAEFTAQDPDKPVFILLHQGIYNTVAGTLPGQGWDGVGPEAAVKNILKKYKQAIIVSGHSHWEMNSEDSMFPGSDEMSIALNTASVSYLWTSYNYITGEHLDGSHAYYVRVYDDKVVYMGRDIENGQFMPSAIFVLEPNKIEVSQDAYATTVDKSVSLDVTVGAGQTATFEVTDSSIASVTKDGTVVPKKEGVCEVIITAGATNNRVINRKTVTVTITKGENAGDQPGVTPGVASAARLAGDNRYETAFKVADELKAMQGVEKFDTVIVAYGQNFADALSGSYLAAVKNAPILLVDKARMANVKAYITENLKVGGKVYILGGTNAIPATMENGLGAFEVKRFAGKDRYETNLMILNEAGVGDKDILVATGLDFADSLSASATGLPVLLVRHSLTGAQKTLLSKCTGKKIILGGTNAVPAKVEEQLKAYGTVERIGGANRYETSTMIAEKFFSNPESVVLAYAMNYPDGLSGGPIAYLKKAPMILTADNRKTDAVNYATKHGIKSGYILGGDKCLVDSTARAILGLDTSTPIVEK